MNPKTTLGMGVAFLGVFLTLAILKLTNAPTDAKKAADRGKVIPGLSEIDAANVTEVSLKRDNDQLEFNYVDAGDHWQMTKPLDVLAQTSAVNDIFFDLKNLARSSSGGKDDSVGVTAPKTATDLVQYGLDTPKSTIEVKFKPKGSDKATGTVTLLVGAPTADKEGLYVKLANEKFVFVVNKTALRCLDKKLSDFRQQKLVTASRFDSDQLRLEWPDRKIDAEKKDSKWRLVEPVADRADSNKVEELIGKLGDLKADGDNDYIEDAASDLAKYGLDTPQLVAEVRKPGSKPKADDKKKEKSKEKEKPTIVEKVLIGKPVEGRDDKVYAKLADQKYVIAVAASILTDLAKQPNDLRSHDLVEVTQSDVDYVRIHRAGGEIDISKKDREWELIQPKSTKAEQAAITELLKKIDDLDVKEFIDQGDLKEYELDAPTLDVAIWQKGLKTDDKDAKSTAKKDDKKEETKDAKPAEPTGEPIRVAFGKRDDEKKLVYVRRGDEPTIFAVSSEGLMDIVDRDYLAYRNKQVQTFLQADVAKLTVVRDGKAFSVDHKKLKEDDLQESWQMSEPVTAPADVGTVSRIVSGLARLNAKKFYAEGDVDLKAYGLDEPQVRATAALKAQGDKESEQHVLLIGGAVPDGGGAYAKLGNQNIVFSVDQVLIDDLKSELHDHAIAKFDSFKAEGLTLTWGDGKKLDLINRKPDGQASKVWSVPNNEEFKLDTRKVTDLVTQLALLNSDHFAQYTGDFTEGQGLNPAALLVEVKVEGESNPKTIRIGAPAEGERRYIASGEKSGPVALVAEDRFKDLVAGPAYFAQPEEKKPETEPDKSEPAKPDDSKKDDAKKDDAKKEDSKKDEAKSDADKKEPAESKDNSKKPDDGDKKDDNKSEKPGDSKPDGAPK
jgi:hypothetical protein